jgi:hypothetical protein
VKYAGYHLLAAWDPYPRTTPREAVLRDFDGHPGLTLRLPVDGQVRMYVLQDNAPRH